MRIVKMIFFIHFILLFIYCFPDNYTPDLAQKISSSYANPLFQGRWNLFAPEPPKQHKEFRYRYRNWGMWSNWEDPTSVIKERHDFSRIGPSTKMYHVLQNGAHYLWEDYYKYSKDSVEISFGYQSMKHMVGQMIKDNHFLAKPKPNIDSVEMILIIRDIDILKGEGNILSDTLIYPSFNYPDFE